MNPGWFGYMTDITWSDEFSPRSAWSSILPLVVGENPPSTCESPRVLSDVIHKEFLGSSAIVPSESTAQECARRRAPLGQSPTFLRVRVYPVAANVMKNKKIVITGGVVVRGPTIIGEN